MSNILEANENYPFDKLKLSQPRRTQGGAAFCNLFVDNDEVYVQLPKCATKNGIHKSGNKQYIDLLFTNDNASFIEWYQTMEEHLVKKLYENREEWFDGDLDLDDIEYNWQSGIRNYKKKNYLLRANIPNNKKGKGIKIWNEHQKESNLEYLDENSKVICILEFSGVRISQTFSLDIHIRQLMIFKDVPLMNKCLININDEPTKEKQPLPTTESTPQPPPPTTESIPTPPTPPTTTESMPTPPSPTTTESMPTPPSPTTTESTPTETNIDESETEKNTENLNENRKELNSDTQESLEEQPTNNKDLVKTEYETKKDTTEIGTLEAIDLNNLDVSSGEKIKKIELQDRQTVYIKMYKDALEKARLIKKQAIKQYLEAKKIKKTYLLEDVEDSSDEELDYLSD